MRMAMAAAAVVAVLGSGCNCIGSSFTVKRTFPVVALEGAPTCAKTRGRVALQDDEAFRDALPHLGGLRLENASVAVGRVADGNAATRADGALRIAESETATAQTLGMFANLAVEENTAQDLALDVTASKDLSRLVLTPPHVLYIEGEGCSDATPAIYALEATFTFFAQLRAF